MGRWFATASALLACLQLSACSNSPQQPSEIIDESPAAGVRDGAREPDDETTGSIETTTPDDGIEPGTAVGPIATGAEVARSSTFNAIAGRWAPTAGDCAAGGDYEISASSVERPGQLCAVAELIDAGENSVTAALLCPSGQEGTLERELLRLSLQEDALNVNLVGSQEPPTTLQRCEP